MEVRAGDLRKAAGKYAIHPAAVQRNNGAYLVFLRGPDPMPAFVSKDAGETWSGADAISRHRCRSKAAGSKLASEACSSSASITRRIVGGGTFDRPVVR